MTRTRLCQLAVDIVASYIASSEIKAAELPDLIRAVSRDVAMLATGAGADRNEKPKPAVAVSKSIQDDFIVCLEDGKRLKMLRRHLRATYDMSPEKYRKKWGLAADYPMVAPAYALQRSAFAKKAGLGRNVRRKT